MQEDFCSAQDSLSVLLLAYLMYIVKKEDSLHLTVTPFLKRKQFLLWKLLVVFRSAVAGNRAASGSRAAQRSLFFFFFLLLLDIFFFTFIFFFAFCRETVSQKVCAVQSKLASSRVLLIRAQHETFNGGKMGGFPAGHITCFISMIYRTPSSSERKSFC